MELQRYYSGPGTMITKLRQIHLKISSIVLCSLSYISDKQIEENDCEYCFNSKHYVNTISSHNFRIFFPTKGTVLVCSRIPLDQEGLPPGRSNKSAQINWKYIIHD